MLSETFLLGRDRHLLNLSPYHLLFLAHLWWIAKVLWWVGLLEHATSIAHHLWDSWSEIWVLLLKHLLLDIDCLNELYRVLNVLSIMATVNRHTTARAFASLGLDLLVGKCKLLLGSWNLVDELALIECLLGDHLSSQVLDLRVQSLLDGIVLLSHNVSPDGVQLVENLTDTSLWLWLAELLLDFQNSPHSLSWNPVVVLLGLNTLETLGASLSSWFDTWSLASFRLGQFRFEWIGCLDDIVVIHISIFTGSSQQLQEPLIVSLQRVKLDL